MSARSQLARDGYRPGLLVGAAVGFFLANLPAAVCGFVVLGCAGSYATYQVVRAALETR